jgi:hypothetical protein
MGFTQTHSLFYSSLNLLIKEFMRSLRSVALMQKSKQKKSRLHFILSSYGRNYFRLQNCDLLGDIRAKLSSSQKAAWKQVGTFCCTKITRENDAVFRSGKTPCF